MNRKAIFTLVAFAAFLNVSAAPSKGKAPAGKDAAALEKEKAQKHPYANDILDEKEHAAFLKSVEENYVKKYPAQYQEGFKLVSAKCAQCHTASRPLNSQFVEPAGKDLADRNKATEALKKTNPELFKDKNVWQVEGDIWQRYVKRMMAKPGCAITKDEGKKIWEFLAYDSTQRKIGPGKEAWLKHRQGLLNNFKAKHPERFKELYGSAK